MLPQLIVIIELFLQGSAQQIITIPGCYSYCSNISNVTDRVSACEIGCACFDYAVYSGAGCPDYCSTDNNDTYAIVNNNGNFGLSSNSVGVALNSLGNIDACIIGCQDRALCEVPSWGVSVVEVLTSTILVDHNQVQATYLPGQIGNPLIPGQQRTGTFNLTWNAPSPNQIASYSVSVVANSLVPTSPVSVAISGPSGGNLSTKPTSLTLDFKCAATQTIRTTILLSISTPAGLTSSVIFTFDKTCFPDDCTGLCVEGVCGSQGFCQCDSRYAFQSFCDFGFWYAKNLNEDSSMDGGPVCPGETFYLSFDWKFPQTDGTSPTTTDWFSVVAPDPALDPETGVWSPSAIAVSQNDAWYDWRYNDGTLKGTTALDNGTYPYQIWGPPGVYLIVFYLNNNYITKAWLNVPVLDKGDARCYNTLPTADMCVHGALQGTKCVCDQSYYGEFCQYGCPQQGKAGGFSGNLSSNEHGDPFYANHVSCTWLVAPTITVVGLPDGENTFDVQGVNITLLANIDPFDNYVYIGAGNMTTSPSAAFTTTITGVTSLNIIENSSTATMRFEVNFRGSWEPSHTTGWTAHYQAVGCPWGASVVTDAVTNDLICQVCPIGTFSPFYDFFGDCLPCPENTYGDVVGLSACHPLTRPLEAGDVMRVRFNTSLMFLSFGISLVGAWVTIIVVEDLIIAYSKDKRGLTATYLLVSGCALSIPSVTCSVVVAATGVQLEAVQPNTLPQISGTIDPQFQVAYIFVSLFVSLAFNLCGLLLLLIDKAPRIDKKGENLVLHLRALLLSPLSLLGGLCLAAAIIGGYYTLLLGVVAPLDHATHSGLLAVGVVLSIALSVVGGSSLFRLFGRLRFVSGLATALAVLFAFLVFSAAIRVHYAPPFPAGGVDRTSVWVAAALVTSVICFAFLALQFFRLRLSRSTMQVVLDRAHAEVKTLETAVKVAEQRHMHALSLVDCLNLYLDLINLCRPIYRPYAIARAFRAVRMGVDPYAMIHNEGGIEASKMGSKLGSKHGGGENGGGRGSPPTATVTDLASRPSDVAHSQDSRSQHHHHPSIAGSEGPQQYYIRRRNVHDKQQEENDNDGNQLQEGGEGGDGGGGGREKSKTKKAQKERYDELLTRHNPTHKEEDENMAVMLGSINYFQAYPPPAPLTHIPKAQLILEFRWYLRHPVCVEIIKDMMVAKRGEENLLCYLDVVQYRKLSAQGRAWMGPHIYKSFIDPAAPSAANLASHILKEVEGEVKKGHWTAKIFRKVEESMVDIMFSNIWGEFKASPAFQECLYLRSVFESIHRSLSQHVASSSDKIDSSTRDMLDVEFTTMHDRKTTHKDKESFAAGNPGNDIDPSSAKGGQSKAEPSVRGGNSRVESDRGTHGRVLSADSLFQGKEDFSSRSGAGGRSHRPLRDLHVEAKREHDSSDAPSSAHLRQLAAASKTTGASIDVEMAIAIKRDTTPSPSGDGPRESHDNV